MVQSFSPNDAITPQEAHDIGIETVNELLPNSEVGVATHVNSDTYHNNFVINSVQYTNGKKLHFNHKSIFELRAVSD